MDVRRLSDCEAAQRLASAQMDAELSPFERTRLQRHLDVCGACRAFEADLRAIGDLLRDTPLEPFERRLLLPRRRRRALPRIAVGAAAAAVFAATFAGPSRREESAPQARAARVIFDVDRDLRDIRRELLKPLPVHVPGARSLNAL